MIGIHEVPDRFNRTLCGPRPRIPTSYRPSPTHKPGEPGHRDVLAGAGVDGRDDVRDGLGVVLDELLVEQDGFAIPGAQLAVGDLFLDVRGLVGHL